MRTLKKTLCLILALVMVLGVCAISATADFTDQAAITYDEAVAVMKAAGVLDGYDDGSFQPATILNRGQAAKMIACMMGFGDLKGTTDFKDTKGHWSESYVAFCVAQGIVAGYGNGNFGPEDTLTGSAWAKMVLCAVGFDAKYEGFGAGDADWEINVAKLVKAKGLAANLDSFDGTKPVSREVASELAFQGMQLATRVYKSGLSVTGTGLNVIAPGTYTVHEDAAGKPTATLLKDLGIECDDTAAPDDAFGRPADYCWYVDKNGGGTRQATETIVYTEPTAAAQTLTVTSLSKVAALAVNATNSTPTVANDFLTALNYDLKITARTKTLNAWNSGVNVVVNNVAANTTTLKAGDIVEIYTVDGTPRTIDKIVVTQYQAAKVTEVKDLTATQLKTLANDGDPTNDAATKNVSYSVANTTGGAAAVTILDTAFAGFAYEKNDYVLVAVGAGNAVLDSRAAKTVSGKVDATKDTASRVNGTFYTVATTNYIGAAAPTMAIGTDATWALDVNGEVFATVVATAVTSSNYAYVYRITETTGVADADGVAGKAYTAYAVLADGTKASWPVTKDTTATYVKGDTSGAVFGALASWNGDSTQKAVVAYSIVDGKFEVTAAAETIKTATLAGTGTSASIDSGNAYANSGTSYIFVNLTGLGTTGVTVTTATGYKAAKWDSTAGVSYIYNPLTKTASYVFVPVANAYATATANTVAVLASKTPVVEPVAASTYTYTYSIFVDGEASTLTLNGTQNTAMTTAMATTGTGAQSLDVGDIFEYSINTAGTLTVTNKGGHDYGDGETLSYVSGTQIQGSSSGTKDIGSAKIYSIEYGRDVISVTAGGSLNATENTDGNRVILIDDGASTPTITHVFIINTVNPDD